MKQHSAERKRFVILLLLLVASIALLVYVRSNLGQEFTDFLE